VSGSSAAQITKRSKSNLAFALRCLPKERRGDMVTFYAFCRIVDDLADEPDGSKEEREEELATWKYGLIEGFDAPDFIQAGIVNLISKYSIDIRLFIELIEGMEMDLRGVSYTTFEELKGYCYKVASVVGLISLRIFGADYARSQEYAINLGYALQLTNIIRDLSEDYSMGRIYLPSEEIDGLGLKTESLLECAGTREFQQLISFQAERAEFYFKLADESLYEADYKVLKSARSMGKIYRSLLNKMRKDGFKVANKRYRVSTLKKLFIMISA